MSTGGYWLAIASAAHVRIGRAQGFMQVNHGKRGPLARIAPGDLVAYYSPTTQMGVKDGLQSFTALGRARDGVPYQAEMTPDFHPFRRDVDWFSGRDAPIAPLLTDLSFTRGQANWGYQLRFGLLRVTAEDMARIAAAMGAR